MQPLSHDMLATYYENPARSLEYDSADWVTENYEQLNSCTRELSCECWETLFHYVNKWADQNKQYNLTVGGGTNIILGYRRSGLYGFADSTLPQPVRDLLQDISFESIQIFLDMTGMKYLWAVVGKLVSMDNWGIIEKLYEYCPDAMIRKISPYKLLRMMVTFAPLDFLLKILMDMQSKRPVQIAKFRDKEQNNLLHYYFIRAPWNPSGTARQILDFLISCGVNPDMPNADNVSSNYQRKILDMYFRQQKRPLKC